MEEHPFLRPQMQDVVQYFVDKVLITNQSTDFDSLFIDLVINPWNDTLYVQIPSCRGSSIGKGSSRLPLAQHHNFTYNCNQQLIAIIIADLYHTFLVQLSAAT
jgi:hypothetical protein